jgi:hypothetical protein
LGEANALAIASERQIRDLPVSILTKALTTLLERAIL